MSDGAEEKKRGDDEHNAAKRANPNDFGRAVARVSVAQVCDGIGFEGFRHSALDALSEIAIRYICDLGRTATHYSNLAGRSESNPFDVVKSLEDLGATKGFNGASLPDRCSIESGALKEVVDYVQSVDEIPFSQPIPQFPVSKTSNGNGGAPSSSRNLKHIPEWLPAFPEAHTFRNSPVWNEKRADNRIKNTEHVRQRRKAESSLLRLQQRLMGGSSEKNLSPTGGDSQISVPTKLVSTEPDKKHGSFVQLFAPAIDAVKCREMGSIDVDKRPVVQFRLKTGKKLRGESVDVSLRSRSEGERAPVLSFDEERDEKKRRAEQILRQSMASPQETAQNVN